MNWITLISSFIYACSFIDSISAQSNIGYKFLEHVSFKQCEGKESGNYTLVVQFQRNTLCQASSSTTNSVNELLSCSSQTKQTDVNSLKTLSVQVLPNGALIIYEIFSLVTSGPLQGKYVYFREVRTATEYLKICSSVLGQSVLTSISDTLLISDKLDLNVFVAPTGAFEAFKKGCTTVCQGSTAVVGTTQLIK